MRTVTIELPDTVEIGPTAKAFLTVNWSGEFILENALHGLKQRRSDKWSVTKDKDKLAALDADILAGNVLGAGGGGGGPRQDAETKGLLAWMNATRGPKAPLLTGKTMGDRLEAITREQVILSMREAGLTDADIKGKAKDIAAAAKDADNLAQVKAALVEGPAKPFVDAEREKEVAAAKATKAGAGLKVTLKI